MSVKVRLKAEAFIIVLYLITRYQGAGSYCLILCPSGLEI